MPPTTFAELFCAQHNIPPEKYESAVFKRTLYWRVRPIAWLLSLMNRNHFNADIDLIKAVAHLTRLRNFAIEAERFHDHPYNRGILRWRFRMRISTTQLRSLVKKTFHDAGVPHDGSPNGGSRPSV